VYDKTMLLRARAMERLTDEALRRHEAFDRGNEELAVELEATRKLLQPTVPLETLPMPARYSSAAESAAMGRKGVAGVGPGPRQSGSSAALSRSNRPM
jgi:hypothetical protein